MAISGHYLENLLKSLQSSFPSSFLSRVLFCFKDVFLFPTHLGNLSSTKQYDRLLQIWCHTFEFPFVKFLLLMLLFVLCWQNLQNFGWLSLLFFSWNAVLLKVFTNLLVSLNNLQDIAVSGVYFCLLQIRCFCPLVFRIDALIFYFSNDRFYCKSNDLLENLS